MSEDGMTPHSVPSLPDGVWVVAERQCPVCGRHFHPRTGQHRFCKPVCRERAKSQLRTLREPARYGHVHKKLREQLAVQIARGGVVCVRCGGSILPSEPFDLGHVDGTNMHAGPEHQYCNRAAGAVKSNGRVETFEDDPGRGVFWGPPHTRDGLPQRWSRAWYDWRPLGG
jgi:hypothetical protein